MSANEANIMAIMGASGSGKSLTVKSGLAASPPRRLLVWDAMDEYSPHAKSCSTLRELVDAMREQPAFQLRIVPRGSSAKIAERFAVFCAAAFAAGDLTMIIEELQTVTSPSHAAAEWSDCTLRGRHRGLCVVGISQRPASVDKNFFGNATRVRTGRLNYADDVRCMANVLNVAAEDVAALRPLEYIERRMATGEIERGMVAVPGRQAAASTPDAKKSAKR